MLGGMFLVFAIYFITLYDMQVINGEYWNMYADNHRLVSRTVEATRGRLMDRHEIDLVSNRSVNNVMLDWVTLANSPQNTNAVLLQIAELARSMGRPHTDTLAITGSPFTYAPMTETQRNHLNRYIRHHERAIRNLIRDMSTPEFEIDPDYYEVPLETPVPEELSVDNVTAVQLMAFMRQLYNISAEYTAEETRTLAGIRYEVALRHGIVGMDEYIFVEDASVELISAILEHNFPGVTVQPSSMRRFNTTVAAHVIGRVGPMMAEDVPLFPDYPLDAQIGIDGIERDFEAFLHGVNGSTRQTVTAGGVIVGQEITREPQPGGNVVTTLDISLQTVAEAALRSTIREINATRGREADYAPAGGVVAIDPRNGDVLAIASTPTFQLENFSAQFPDLVSDEIGRPLMNRATGGVYEPGSAFKMVTAMAALERGIITEHTPIFCGHRFMAFEEEGYTPRCMGRHGYISLREAISVSCNVYFFQLAYWLGWSGRTGLDRMSETAELFGLGELTGIGFGEVPGQRSTWETMLARNMHFGYDTVFGGEIIQVGIGQGASLFTPIQMANYTAMIASGGIRYQPRLLREVRSYDNSAILYIPEPVVMADMREEWGSLLIGVQEGMHMASTHGTAAERLAGFHIPVASKTGTVEVRGEDAAGPYPHGVFVAYAPVDDPQIAIAVVIEQGGSGSAVIPVARAIFEHFFRTDTIVQRMPLENVFLR